MEFGLQVLFFVAPYLKKQSRITTTLHLGRVQAEQLHRAPWIQCCNKVHINPLNAESIPICHLLILLGDLTFMGTCIVSISNKMQRYTVYLYLETALHVSGGASTHHQGCIQLYLQDLVFVTPSLLSAAIVEELEQV
jgi:hypothetical protein